MTCDNTLTLPCQEPCGLVSTGMISEVTGTYYIVWEVGPTTYKHRIRLEDGEELAFNWPFGSHGAYTIKIEDEEGTEVEFTDGVDTYDCFQVVGIPVKYSIDPGELETLEGICNPE